MSNQATTWVHSVTLASPLGPTERSALYFLCFRHNAKTGECYPSMATIAEHAGVSERRAREAIRNLEDAGLIHSIRRVGQAGNSSNQYNFPACPTVRGITPSATKSRVETGTKNGGETGHRVPAQIRQTVADDKESPFQEKKEGFLAKKKMEGAA